ncbi:hypothetical protein NE237_031404 [Protea cynaroides]|uniref:Uncharacterized protein n=1 Tax=Protea cynaroides TaxID=273540 RepID=A0A9Q0L1D7_9MAGN|nr:hypothetical protein NE237_031404 [Protea cynaroides]
MLELRTESSSSSSSSFSLYSNMTLIPFRPTFSGFHVEPTLSGEVPGLYYFCLLLRLVSDIDFRLLFFFLILLLFKITSFSWVSFMVTLSVILRNFQLGFGCHLFFPYFCCLRKPIFSPVLLNSIWVKEAY